MGATRPNVNGGTISVTDSTALAALNASGLPPGSAVFNVDVGLPFVLTLSTAALDPDVVVEVSGTVGARWIVDPGGGSAVNAAYVVAEDDPALPNAIDLSSLGSGILQQIVALGVATLSAFSGTARSILFLGTGSVLEEDSPAFRWWSDVHRLGIGTGATTPLKQIHVHNAVDGGTAIVVSNNDEGISAIAGMFAIRSPDTVNDFSVGHFMTGEGYAGAGGFILPGEGVAEHTNKTEETDFVFSRFGPGGFRWIVTTTIPPTDEDRATRMDLSDDGALSLPTSLAAGGYVRADVTTGTLTAEGTPATKTAGVGSGELTLTGTGTVYEPRYAADGTTVLGWVALLQATVNP